MWKGAITHGLWLLAIIALAILYVDIRRTIHEELGHRRHRSYQRRQSAPFPSNDQTNETRWLSCPTGWILSPTGSKCFRAINTTGLTWFESLLLCERVFHAQLPTVEDAQENEFIFENFVLPIKKTSYHHDTYMWMGLVRLSPDPLDYIWYSNGETITFSALDDGPNTKGEQDYTMYCGTYASPNTNGSWTWFPCNNLIASAVLCQMNLASDPLKVQWESDHRCWSVLNKILAYPIDGFQWGWSSGKIRITDLYFN